MTSEMEQTPLYFLLFVRLFIKNNVNGEYRYKFEVETIEKITLVSPNEAEELMYQEDHLFDLTLEERKNLCRSAYVASGLPAIRKEYVFEAEVYRFTFSDESYDNDTDVGIKCPTLPPLYLRVEEHSEENKNEEDLIEIIIWISFIRPPLTKRFPFDIEVVESIFYISPSEATKYKPIDSDKTWQDEAETNELYNLEPEDLWGLCTIVARDHFHRSLQFFAHVGVRKPQIYTYNRDSGLAFVAFGCNSYPYMYLRLKNDLHSERVIKAIFMSPELEHLEKFGNKLHELEDSSSDS